MKSRSLILPLIISAFVLPGCAGQSTMQSKNMAAVPSMTVNASKDKVVEVTKRGITNLGYNLKDLKAGDPVTEVYFSKPVSAFSWGEVGRVDVKELEPTKTEVSVGSEKRSQLQITGTSQSEFAEQIFTQIKAELY